MLALSVRGVVMGARDEGLRTTRWRESFANDWRGRPQRVKLPAPGKVTRREILLDGAVRLAAIAQANGELVGRAGDPYTERQLATALGLSRNTARGVLRWFEAEGWLSVRPTHSKRAADERVLVIPPTATIAPPGWPLVPVVGHSSSSTGDPQVSPDVEHSITVVEHSNEVVEHSTTVVEHPLSSNGAPPPGNPVTLLPGSAAAKAAETGDMSRAGVVAAERFRKIAKARLDRPATTSAESSPELPS